MVDSTMELWSSYHHLGGPDEVVDHDRDSCHGGPVMMMRRIWVSELLECASIRHCGRMWRRMVVVVHVVKWIGIVAAAAVVVIVVTVGW